ncbi:MAG: glycosyltransferase [Fibrobacterota bacterium]|nr:glycosyltransferase [Fibrobacterota bacterium]QQS06348.1 MAG: glycosyltransferase [Fibrobacterota bacterium]
MEKILWLTNTPCKASDLLCPGNVIGGWLYSLSEIYGKNHPGKLHISFFWEKDISPFEFEGVEYIPIFSPRKPWYIRLLNRAGFGSGEDRERLEKILPVISKLQPDLIHIHGTEECYGLIVESIDIPAVISIQGILSPYVDKYFSGIPEDVANRFLPAVHKIGLNNHTRRRNLMHVRALREQRILASARNVAGRTAWDRRVSKVLSPSSRYFHCDEILRGAFLKSNWCKTVSNGELKIVTTMSDGLYKGLEMIAKTARLLSKQTGVRFKWIVIGQREDSEVAKIVERWLGYKFSDCYVEFAGKCTENEIVKILKSSDIYCQVSHIENSPNSLCEAMLLGVPVVASAAGGTTTLIEDGVNGILFQDGDCYGLCGTLLELNNNDELQLKISETAAKQARKRHDPNSVIGQLNDMYREILNVKG